MHKSASDNQELSGPKGQQCKVEKPWCNRISKRTSPSFDFQCISQALVDLFGSACLVEAPGDSGKQIFILLLTSSTQNPASKIKRKEEKEIPPVTAVSSGHL